MEPLVQLAEALAAALQSAFPSVSYGDVEHAVTSVWEPEPSFALESADLVEPKLWVIDFAETLAAQGIVGNEEYALLVIVQQKLVPRGAARREQILALGSLAAQIGRTCRPMEPEDAYVLACADVTAVCTHVKRQPVRNVDDSRKGLFYTELLTTWKAA